MSNFVQFAAAVQAKWKTFANRPIFAVNLAEGEAREVLYAEYQDAFPAGQNEIYRERRQHDCNCCKSFIRNIGAAVTIDPETYALDTVWNIPGLEFPYDVVAAKMHENIVRRGIGRFLYCSESSYGQYETVEFDESGKNVVKRWNHLNGSTFAFLCGENRLRDSGLHFDTFNMFKNSQTLLNPAVVTEILALARPKQPGEDREPLYRGAEKVARIEGYIALCTAYDQVKSELGETLADHALHLMLAGSSQNMFSAGLKNDVIGTLIEDVSSGADLNSAVGSYEYKVSAGSYKRTSAPISAQMTQKANDTLVELGLENAIFRRHATLADVNVNDVLWSNSSSTKKMKGGIMDLLAKDVASGETFKKSDHPVKIAIKDFMDEVLPKAASVHALVASSHISNFVSITAPAKDADALLFKWANPFAWSYNGNYTDRIVERVKKAGGAVDGLLRVSLMWHNLDDLDLHAETPLAEHIYFANRRGILDVDANSPSSLYTEEPVENMNWSQPKDGIYTFKVDQYTRRAAANQGYTVQIATKTEVLELVCDRNENASFSFEYANGVVKMKSVDKNLRQDIVRKVEVWGVKTESFVNVQTVMLSPNFWNGEKQGNKHFMFMLEGCKNPDSVRGFYNEFLKPELVEHRKVFEILGERTMFNDPVGEQLSGLGFSSTLSAALQVAVKNAEGRVSQYLIQF